MNKYDIFFYLCFIGVILTGIYCLIGLPNDKDNLGKVVGLLAISLGSMGCFTIYMFRDTEPRLETMK